LQSGRILVIIELQFWDIYGVPENRDGRSRQRGEGISWVVASTGTEVILIDKTDRLVEKGMRIISEEMDKEIEKRGLTEAEKRVTLSRVRGSTDMSHAAEVGLVIEATPEDLELERNLVAKEETSAMKRRLHLW